MTTSAHSAVTPVGGPPGVPHDRGLRRVRRLTTAFAWIGGVVFAVRLAQAGGVVGGVASVAVALVLGGWLLWPEEDGWGTAFAEAAIVVTGVLVLPDPQPVLGFLFGVTVRRALLDGAGRFPVKAACPVLGYVLGFGASIVLDDRDAAPLGPEVLAPALMPLLGLLIGTAALHETARAAHLAEAARRHADDAHRTTEAVVRASPVGLALLDGDGRPELFNDRVADLLGWASPGTVPCPHGTDITGCPAGCARAGEEPVELRVDRDGGATALTLHPTGVEGDSRPGRVVVAVVDVTARRALEDALRERSERDELTGLFGRRHFLGLVDRALAAGARVALLLVDLDRFKEVNDTAGHQAGDRRLVEAARLLRSTTGPDDVVARLGGDEFAVLTAVPDDGDGGVPLAERVLAALAGPGGRAIRASIGIAVPGRAGTGRTSEDLLRDADVAMYVAKREGGGRARSFERAMGEDVAARQRDQADLRAALTNEELVLHYQPIIDLAEARTTHAEALVRWRHPGRGLLGPDRFIGLAEETGLIVPLGAHVLRSACGQAVRWQRGGHPLGVAVNVSPWQLAGEAFPRQVDELLTTTGLEAGLLTVEVTESVWADEAAMRVLMDVRDLGVRIALDDFGTGYSSLNYLRRYPFDLVKIDKSFTDGLGEDDRTEGVVRCIIDLAAVLGARTVAEGVETPDQARWLRDAGCGYLQGYLFGRPDLPENWRPGLLTDPQRLPSA
ncbi:bifunctional diguanylate cyclase/phosphodiesterase [Saccharothrix longispora]|uniref:putative bifunctional diguanylate cyclase/phosphodiesterase n=1 Tax=Saccharothrix longispora TaxID=33920 RepID=UPI0028FD16F2|nr:bifunctional diguanylate cyclase/phosphodiesterase [Saccharothrix longispora]MBY8850427.1 GGDEF domain-containing protein [Saccharothrix sp. MB29]MDU0288190.1 bifunctional diguanylate cyclase/phosphodiesterase [Saccharothrix longispora]